MVKLSVLIAVCAAVLATSAYAAGPRGPGGPRGGMHGPPPMNEMLARHAERLELDDATLGKIESLARASHGEQRAFHEELRDLHRELRDLLQQDTPDEAAVFAKADAIGAVESASHKNRLRTMLSIRALLTQKQRDELVKIREEGRRAHWEGIETACAAELESFCPDTAQGRETVRCLMERRDELSQTCRDTARPRRHGPMGRRGGGGEPPR